MPCSSYEPSPTNLESYAVCGHLKYLMTKLKMLVPKNIMAAAQDIYLTVEDLNGKVAYLCELCGGLTTEQQDIFIYNGRDRDARALADWWDRHQELDRLRILQEQEIQRQKEVREVAISKLTPEEIKILNIKI